jgi:hemoglobin
MSIYAEIGGREAVAAAVAGLYDRILADPTLVPYFEGVDMDRLARHQRAFVGAALGGPVVYAGRDMAAAHAGLGITPEAFGAVVGHLVDTLTSLGVPEGTIGQIGGALAPLQADIVTAPAGGESRMAG